MLRFLTLSTYVLQCAKYMSRVHLGYMQAYQIIRNADLDRKLLTVDGQPAFSSLCLGLHLASVRGSLKASSCRHTTVS